MAKRPTISSITTGYSSTTLLNNNFEALRNAFDNTLSLDGSSPNSLSSDLDINSNDITNAKSVTTTELILGGSRAVNLATTLTFIGAWGASTSYTLNNIVTDSGNAYISLIAHTSGSTFSTDLSAGKWALLASKGASGSGSGDLLASNNLSDLASAATALGNLGLSATATEINYTTDVTSNIQAQINGKQASNDILTDLAGLTQATNKIPYFSSATAASVLDFKDEDNMSSNSATAIPSQQSVKAYVDSSGVTKYTSAQTSITDNQLLTFSHGLGATPSFVIIDCIAKVSNADGWSNGDRIQMNQSSDPSGDNEGMGIRTDSSNVYVTIGENGPGEATFRSNGAGTTLTSSKWNIEVKAFLIS